MATQTAFSQAATSPVAEAFFQGIGDAGAALAEMEKVVKIDRDDVASLKKAAMAGITELQAWDGVSDPTAGTLASVDSSFQQTVTYSMYLLNVRIPSHDAMDVPGIIQESARKLGFAVSNTVVGQGWTQAAGLFSIDAADGSPPVAGPVGHLQRGGAHFNNKQPDSALDEAGLATAISVLRKFEDHETTVFDAALGPLALIVPPEVEKTAKELVAPSFSGTDLTANFFAGHQIQVVVNNRMGAEANNWALVPMMTTPIHLWLREAPVITSYQDDATNTVNLRCQMASAAYFTPPGWQVVVGSAPA